MPFTKNATGWVGSKLHIEPHYGNGWLICFDEGDFHTIDTPAHFDVELTDVLSFKSLPHALVFDVSKEFEGYKFRYGIALARTDSPINLRLEKTTCNLMISPAKPSIGSGTDIWNPEFVLPNAKPHIRGFGVVSLSLEGAK